MTNLYTTNGFKGEYGFLSNFHPSLINHDGRTWATAEHLYQAAKTDNYAEQEIIRTALRPGDAKRLGLKCTMRADWNDLRISVMTQIIQLKFDQNPELKQKLMSTGYIELIEYNTWGDRFWGICNGVGQNHLGRILMEYRRVNRTR